MRSLGSRWSCNYSLQEGASIYDVRARAGWGGKADESAVLNCCVSGTGTQGGGRKIQKNCGRHKWKVFDALQCFSKQALLLTQKNHALYVLGKK